MKEYDPLTPSEVNDAAKEFFPLCDIVHRNMPENCTVEDTIKVMETVCDMAQKRRNFDTPGVGPFGFNKKVKELPETDTVTNIFEYGI
jgi:hydroxymethylpyrimidine/phosphomethylpyrimidine kinase